MARNVLFSIDLGTQSARAACFDETGNRLSMAEVAYETRYPRPGWAEQRPSDWWKAVCSCCHQAAAALSDDDKAAAICIGATSSTVLPVDAQGEPMSDAILWMDTRAREECALVNATGHPILSYCGGGVSVEWMLPKTLWLKNNKPDIYSGAHKIVEALDWLNYKLSGEWAASKCNASCKWTFSDVEGGFAEDFFKNIGFPEYAEKWPTTVRAMGEPVGRVTPQAAEALGIKGAPVLIQGGIDAHVGMVGLGTVVPGIMGVIMGTSFVHLALSREAHVHSRALGSLFQRRGPRILSSRGRPDLGRRHHALVQGRVCQGPR